MPRTHRTHRTHPRTRPAPITGADDALHVLLLAATDPPEPETVVLLLDDAHVGTSASS